MNAAPVNTAPVNAVPRVRAATRADLPTVVALAAEHAAYEKAQPPAPDLPRRLAALLFDATEPRLACLVAESAWAGREYLHLTSSPS